MASDNEASCESDPNFAVICAFMEKFGTTCGIQSIDFLELQEMLENTQEGKARTRQITHNGPELGGNCRVYVRFAFLGLGMCVVLGPHVFSVRENRELGAPFVSAQISPIVFWAVYL